jgi:hypothetical protein
MNQVHSDKVKVVKSIADALVVEEVDAQVTREKNIALAVMTADCLPVLLRSIDGDVVAAVHCGWKGLASNVLENTILAMNCERNKIMAWLGPCIGEKCFEVGKEVKQIFEDKNLALGQFFKQTDEVHYLADLKGIAKFILNTILIRQPSINIYGAPIGSIICQIISFGYCFTMLSKSVSLKLSFKKYIIKPLFCSVVMGISAYFAHKAILYITGVNIIALIISSIIAVMIYAFMILLTNSLSKEEGVTLEEVIKASKTYVLDTVYKIMPKEKGEN